MSGEDTGQDGGIFYKIFLFYIQKMEYIHNNPVVAGLCIGSRIPTRSKINIKIKMSVIINLLPTVQIIYALI